MHTCNVNVTEEAVKMGLYMDEQNVNLSAFSSNHR